MGKIIRFGSDKAGCINIIRGISQRSVLQGRKIIVCGPIGNAGSRPAPKIQVYWTIEGIRNENILYSGLTRREKYDKKLRTFSGKTR